MKTKASLEAVREAMTDLAHKGEKLTVEAVLQQTGGSRSTIIPHMRAVRSEWQTTEDEKDAPPPAVTAAAHPMLQALWKSARQMADAAYSQKEARLDRFMEGLEADLATSLAENEHLTAENERLARELEEKAAYVQMLEEDVAQQKQLHQEGQQALARANAELEVLRAKSHEPLLAPEVAALLQEWKEARLSSSATA